MASVFDEPKISYALEKIGDFIHQSGSGALPQWSNTATKIIIDSLRAFGEKVGKSGVEPTEHDLDLAIYAACELQAFVTGDKSDIANRSAASVYRGFLARKIEELRNVERELES
jgi:hypothetical protein